MYENSSAPFLYTIPESRNTIYYNYECLLIINEKYVKNNTRILPGTASNVNCDENTTDKMINEDQKPVRGRVSLLFDFLYNQYIDRFHT